MKKHIEDALGLFVYWRGRSSWAGDATAYVDELLAHGAQGYGPIAILFTEAAAPRLTAGGYTLTPNPKAHR